MKQANDDIRTRIRRFRVQTDPETYQSMLHDVLAAQEQSKKTHPTKIQSDFGRTQMVRKIGILGAAAAAVIVVCVVLLSFANTDKGDLSGRESASSGAGIPSNGQSAARRPIELRGPQTHVLTDGSTVTLSKDARIRTYGAADRRGFEHLAGEIKVSVAKADNEFVVVSPYGSVKALGTVFGMTLLAGKTAGGKEAVELLVVDVEHGSVQVSNAQGSAIIKEGQRATVEKNGSPYDFTQDSSVPKDLVERIQAMVNAHESGDARGWLKNFNIRAVFDLLKADADPTEEQLRTMCPGMSRDRFKAFKEEFSDVESPEELVDRLLPSVNVRKGKLYVRSVILDSNRKKAKAVCTIKENDVLHRYTPQWSHFEGQWWQTDD